MSQTADVVNDDGGSVKVGTTGTIGSLMTRELESTKNSEQASSSSSSSRRKQQTGPVSVPCGVNPRKSLPRRNQTNECGSGINNGSNTGNAHSANHGDGQKPRHTPHKNGHRAPMLGSDDTHIDRSSKTDKMEKKGHTYIVEVVDLKCRNPMSNRLKKLSFSKLSESIS